MEIFVNTKDLVHALSFACSVVEKRNIIAELDNIKLIAKDNILELSSTDMDIYLKQTIGAEVVVEGETTVNAQTISNIIRKISDSKISLKNTKNSEKFEILAMHCSFNLPALPSKLYPHMDDVAFNNCFEVSSKDLIKIIEYTHFAVSTDETRYNLNGVYFHTDNKNFYGVATDSHRLSVASVEISDQVNTFGVIIPKKTISELLKIIKDSRNSNSQIQLYFATNKIKFQCNNMVLISKLIDGNFPEYSSFIPAIDQNKYVTVNTKLLASAIDRVATVTVDKFRAIKLIINSSGLTITASGAHTGIGTENIKFSNKRDDYCQSSNIEIAIGFNPVYIIDVLRALQAEQVTIYFQDSFSPVMLQSSDEKDKDQFVIMPIKI